MLKSNGVEENMSKLRATRKNTKHLGVTNALHYFDFNALIQMFL
jgi:hypothetical protein